MFSFRRNRQLDIAAAMKQAVPKNQQVLTFSIGFEDPLYDETKFAAHVANHLGTMHRQFTVQIDAASELPKLARFSANRSAIHPPCRRIIFCAKPAGM